VFCYRGIITRRQPTINKRPSMMILCIAVAVALLDTLRYNLSASISMRSQMISLCLLLFFVLPLYTEGKK